MRKVTFLPILLFQLLLAFPVLASLWLAVALDEWAGQFALGGVLLAVLVFVTFYALLTVVYRLYLKFCPLPVGEIAVGSRDELHYLVYILFWLMLFLPLLRPGVIPTPLSRLVLIALGARVGEGTYSSGLVFDPHFVSIGSATQLGIECLLIPHAQDGGRLAHYPIRIGSQVTIGARAIIMPGVTIEDGAVIGVGSLLTRGSHVQANEVWAGTPARLIRKAQS